jgi:hypothetical protein
MRSDTEALRSGSGIKKPVMTAWLRATMSSGSPVSSVISNTGGISQTYFHAVIELCRLKHWPLVFDTVKINE